MIKKDSVITGIISGIIAPIIGFWIYYFYNFRRFTPGYFIQFIYQTNLVAPILSICLVANLLIFLLFIKKLEYDETAKGVLISTILYALVILYFKFLK